MSTSTNPNYFNRFAPEKNYKKILFLAGQALQSAELNELQDIIVHELRRISTYLVKSGSILSGAEAGAVTSTHINMGSGTIFVDGITVEVAASAVPIIATDMEIIGVALMKQEITSDLDPDLREPDPNSPDYGQPGANREKYITRWTKSTAIVAGETFFPIITLNNGVIVSSSASTDSDTQKMKNVLAEYDRDTRGSYLISGLNIEYLKRNGALPNTGKYVFNVLSGKARVNGNDVGASYVRTFVCDEIVETRLIQAEPVRFTTGATSLVPRYAPLATVTSLMGTKTMLNEPVTHGAFAGATDLLSKTSVLSIRQIRAGATVYVLNVDYQQVGDQIIWSWPGKTSTQEPAPGSTYHVDFDYQDTFTATISADKNSILLAPADTATLVPNTNVFLTYDHLLTRVDRVCLNEKGDVVVLKGAAGYVGVVAPARQPNMLSLATIRLSFNGDPQINKDTIINLTADQANDMRNRIDNLEYNVAILSMIENARAIDPTSNKKNVVVDPLYDYDMVDNGRPMTMLITGRNMFARPSYQAEIVSPVGYFLDFTETVWVDQKLETSSRKINPYAAPSAPRNGIMTLNPSAFSFSRWWWTTTEGTLEPLTTTVTLRNFEPGEAIDIDQIVQFGIAAQSVTANTAGTATFNVTVPVGIREGSYQIRGTGRTSGITTSALLSLNVDQQQIPAEVLRAQLGIVALEASVADQQRQLNNQQDQIGSLRNQVSGIQNNIWQLQQTDASLQSQINRVEARPPVVNNIVNTTVVNNTWWSGWWPVNTDPIAQTFEYAQDFCVTKIRIKVTELPEDDLTIKLVPTRVGIPDKTLVIALATMNRADVRLGWNTLSFDRPIYLPGNQEYAFIVLTGRPTGSIATAKVGLFDSVNNTWVLQQPTTGVSLISANESTWTPVQDEDVTYTMFAAEFLPAREVTLFEMTGLSNVSDWLLTGNVAEFAGTSVKFHIEAAGIKRDISLGIPLITEPLTGTVKIVARMTSTSNRVSPMIAPGMTIQYGTARVTVADPAIYHQRAFAVPGGSVTPATIKLIINEYKPAGVVIKPQFRLGVSPSYTWADATQISTNPIGSGFFETTYELTGVNVDQSQLRIEAYTSIMNNRPIINTIRSLIL